MGGWEFPHLEAAPGLKAQVVWEASATSATGSCWPGREVVIRGLWGPILGRREWSLDEKPLIDIIDDRVLAWHQQNSSYISSDGNHLKNPKDETFNLLRIASSVAVVDPIWVFLKDEDVSWKLWVPEMKPMSLPLKNVQWLEDEFVFGMAYFSEAMLVMTG